jgi:hypothetical protein
MQQEQQQQEVLKFSLPLVQSFHPRVQASMHLNPDNQLRWPARGNLRLLLGG